MAKSSGGLRSKTGGLGRDGGGNYGGAISNEGSLTEIKDVKLRREIQQGISKFQSRIGITKGVNVKVADLDGAYGVHLTNIATGKSAGIYLNRKTFINAKSKDIIAVKKRAYESKFLNSTNKPTQHTVIHELGHSVWNSSMKGEKIAAATPEIRKLYNSFQRANPKAWGSYGKSNINEFVAEGIAKGILAKPDRYTKSLFKIIKKYKL